MRVPARAVARPRQPRPYASVVRTPCSHPSPLPLYRTHTRAAATARGLAQAVARSQSYASAAPGGSSNVKSSSTATSTGVSWRMGWPPAPWGLGCMQATGTVAPLGRPPVHVRFHPPSAVHPQARPPARRPPASASRGRGRLPMSTARSPPRMSASPSFAPTRCAAQHPATVLPLACRGPCPAHSAAYRSQSCCASTGHPCNICL